MLQQINRVFVGAAVAAGLGLAVLPARAAMITFQNETNLDYDVFDLTIPADSPGPLAVPYSGYGSTVSAPNDTTLSLNEGDTYEVTIAYNNHGLGAAGGGHTFTVTGGAAVSTNSNAYFDPSGSTVTLSGLALTLTTTSTTGLGQNPFFYMESGLRGVLYVNGGGGSVYTGVNYMPPADGYYSYGAGYTYLTMYGSGFDDSGSEHVSDLLLTPSSMTVVPNTDGNITTGNPDAPTTYTPTVEPDGHAAGDLVFGNATDGFETIHFDYATPEPASLSLLAVGGLLMLRRRSRVA